MDAYCHAQVNCIIYLSISHCLTLCVPLQEEGKHMLAQGYGKIINTASMATLLVPHPQKQIAYNASKAAVVKITQTLGTEWADRGLNVNCISPGIVNTALIQVCLLCYVHYVLVGMT